MGENYTPVYYTHATGHVVHGERFAYALAPWKQRVCVSFVRGREVVSLLYALL